jgi:tRNA(fMet)-specific endonuclease VapC
MNNRPESVRRHVLALERRGMRATVSSVTAFELWYGVSKSGHRVENMARTAVFLGTTELCLFDADDAEVAGQIGADLERAGTPIGPYDLLIAAQAVRRGLTLVTGNRREFSRVAGLAQENWLRG